MNKKSTKPTPKKTKTKTLKIDKIKVTYFYNGKEVGGYDAVWGPAAKITSERLMDVEHALIDGIIG